MIELRDTVAIDATPEVVWSWLEHLPEHALEWHPDHLGARWLQGESFVPGATMEVREVLHGKPHRLHLVVTEVRPGRRMRYRVFPGASGEFRVDPTNSGSEFTATIDLGVRTPLLAPVIDRLLRVTIGRRIDAIARHQAEEGVRMKALLEQTDLR